MGAEQEEGDDYRMVEALWEPTGVVLLSSSQMEWRRSWEEAGYTAIEEGEQWWLAVESALKGQLP